MIRHPVLLSRQEPVLPVSPLVLRVLPQPVPTMLTTRLRRLTSRLARLPPNPKPMLLLRPRCLCAAVCRASKAENPGRRKASHPPESRPLVARPPVLLRQRLHPHLLRAPRRNPLLSPTPPKLLRLTLRPIRHPSPRPLLLRQPPQPVPVLPVLV